jgi:phosphonate transport system substrate-binding protein
MDERSEEDSGVRRQAPLRPKSRWALGLKILLALVLASGVFFGFYNVAKETYLARRVFRFLPRNWVNLEESNNPAVNSAPVGDERPLFRVAVAPIVSPEKSLEMYQGLIEYLAEKLGMKPVSLYRTTYSETSDLVRYRLCDIAIVCTYPYIRSAREFGMQALVVPRIKGETTYQSFIVVPQSSPAKTLLDLQGKRFASADIVSTTGWLYPAMLLMAAGKNPNTFFGEHVLTGSHDKSLQAVLDGFVDGAAIHGIVFDQMIVENPSIFKRIRILNTSPPFGIPPVVAHPALNPDLKRAVVSAFLDMHNDPRGKLILEKLRIERFVIPEKGLFDSLQQEIKKLEGWK